jgi:beta-glucanase (GH16 family)
MKLYLLLCLCTLQMSCKKKGNSPVENSQLSIQDVIQNEGNNASSPITFKVTLDHASRSVVTVNYKTVEGTARAGDDFTAVTNGTLTFQPNEVEKDVIINVVGDEWKEADENFTVVLSNAVNATIYRSIGTATITNDDTKVYFTNTGYDAPTTYPGYTLAWADEFNGPTLDASSWTNQNGDGCPNLCGWGNNELEYYTDRPDNIFFQDGKLIIEAKKESYAGKSYTSSKILTSGKKAFQFGRIDIRAKLPYGKGIWPALWLLPQDNVYGGWPRSGEIDLMEMVGHEPNKVYGTLHYGPGPGSIQISRSYSLPGNEIFNDAFHVFSLEWKLDQLKLYVDGNLYSTVNKADVGTNNYPFNEKFFLIFNLAVGGNWPGNPDATTSFPQWMVVDYVRVYQ